jgi:hypothetical protein
MRPCWVLATFLGCGGAAPAASGGAPSASTTPWPGELAEEDRYVPSYGKPELARALQRERGAEATAERLVGELEARPERDLAADDRLRVATADLAVRRRFIASLEACEASGRWCPPRLDDPTWSYDPDPDHPIAPPVDRDLRFELAPWRALADELFGRACACRTLACVDSVNVAIDQLEVRPAREVQGDELASQAITRARECLLRLRGRAR